MSATNAIIVLCTCPDAGVAARLARALVEARLAACVNILPGVQSIYRWEGAVHEDSECLLVIKTRAAGFDALRERIVALHPYAVPEIVALDISQGHAPYLAWLAGDASAA